MAVTAIRPESTQHRTASDPARSIWVSASAGTGKTRSLVDRITRLLLDGAAPASLLAITFTRTAAAEMERRVLERLALWSGLDEAALAAALEDIGEPATAERLARARALFLEVLDCPDGLQIRTIHALAQSLLAAFPLEAGLPPRADPLDERGARRLRKEALRRALEEAGRPGGEALRADFAAIAVDAGEGAIDERLPALLRGAAAYAAIGPAEAVEPWLRRWLGLPLAASLAGLLEAAVVPPDFDDGAVRDFAPVLEAGWRGDLESARDLIARWPGLAASDRVRALPDLARLVLTKDGKRRGTKAIAQTPCALPRFDRLCEAVHAALERQREIAFVEHAGAWIRIGMAVSAHYRRLKAAAAAIDFDDMVELAARLLEADGMAGFAARKLDRRIAHVLVDEAQDTNPEQWRLIDRLTADFDSGLGAHDGRPRTRFAVGDFKQAIYRFQGTEPELFFGIRRCWGEQAAAAAQPFTDVPLSVNFRSAPILLKLVDAVLGDLGAGAIGMPAGHAIPPHVPARQGLAGRVLLLAPHVPAEAGADAAPDSTPDAAPDDAPDDGGDAAATAPDGASDPLPPDPAFADRLAKAIAGFLRPGSAQQVIVTPRDGPPRPAGPGDVLILVQARGELMAELVRALHAEGLPVAGVDRLRLAEPLAVRDLLSLLRFVVQPADDLALAEVLVSPLGGLDHERIRALRLPGRTLWESLSAAADPALATVVARLRAALRRADLVGPHAFLQAVLAEGGRAAFRARLGPEADDGLDLLLAEALAFEADQPATLQGFLHHVGTVDQPLGRDPDASPGLVRIMSVHGAKGLEAPIVVLADALRERKTEPGSVTLKVDKGRASLPLVYGKAERRPQPVAAIAAEEAAADAQEHNRLLYVAITRAEQLLLVAGQISRREARARADPKKDPERFQSWHDRIRRAMVALGARAGDFEGLGPGLLLDDGPWPAPAAAAGIAEAPPVPDWARTPPPPEPAPARPFTPSAPSVDEAPWKPASPGQQAAAARGRLLHRLFETLPAAPEERRIALARTRLEAAGIAGEEADDILATVAATLGHPELAPLFSPEALAEAPIAGLVDGAVISGTVDRLRVTDRKVIFADFKTGLLMPETAEAAHPSHLKQMAAYRAVLKAAFPGRAIVPLLVYTAGPRVIPLPDALLDAHAPVASRPADAI